MPPSPHADTTTIEASPLDADLLQRWPMPDLADADKYSRGTVLVIGGSAATPGAVVLAGVAALRMGAGRLQIATAEAVASPVGVAVPEAMVIGLRPSASGLEMSDDLDRALTNADAVLIGPGMIADNPPTDLVRHICDVLGEESLLVVDALALPAFGELDDQRRGIVRSRVVMTPNRQEAARLAELPETHDPADALRSAAQRTGVVLTSFGTVQTPDGRSWVTTSRPAGLGTSGSGDVLAGLVAGAVARSRDLLTGACWATYAHMEAGRRLGESVGEVGYLARELLDQVPQCLPRA
jgi:ADP-dependent NAD(P)H-hydrate dehydratase